MPQKRTEKDFIRGFRYLSKETPANCQWRHNRPMAGSKSAVASRRSHPAIQTYRSLLREPLFQKHGNIGRVAAERFMDETERRNRKWEKAEHRYARSAGNSLYRSGCTRRTNERQNLPDAHACGTDRFGIGDSKNGQCHRISRCSSRSEQCGKRSSAIGKLSEKTECSSCCRSGVFDEKRWSSRRKNRDVGRERYQLLFRLLGQSRSRKPFISQNTRHSPIYTGNDHQLSANPASSRSANRNQYGWMGCTATQIRYIQTLYPKRACPVHRIQTFYKTT